VLFTPERVQKPTTERRQYFTTDASRWLPWRRRALSRNNKIARLMAQGGGCRRPMYFDIADAIVSLLLLLLVI